MKDYGTPRLPHGAHPVEIITLMPNRCYPYVREKFAETVFVGPIPISVVKFLLTDEERLKVSDKMEVEGAAETDPEFYRLLDSAIRPFGRAGCRASLDFVNLGSVNSFPVHHPREIYLLVKTSREALKFLHNPFGGRDVLLLRQLPIVKSKGSLSREVDSRHFDEVSMFTRLSTQASTPAITKLGQLEIRPSAQHEEWELFELESSQGASEDVSSSDFDDESSSEEDKALLEMPEEFRRFNEILERQQQAAMRWYRAQLDGQGELSEDGMDEQDDDGLSLPALHSIETAGLQFPHYIVLRGEYPFHGDSAYWQLWVWHKGELAGACPESYDHQRRWGYLADEPDTAESLARKFAEYATDLWQRVWMSNAKMLEEAGCRLRFVARVAVRKDGNEIWTLSLSPWDSVKDSMFDAEELYYDWLEISIEKDDTTVKDEINKEITAAGQEHKVLDAVEALNSTTTVPLRFRLRVPGEGEEVDLFGVRLQNPTDLPLEFHPVRKG